MDHKDKIALGALIAAVSFVIGVGVWAITSEFARYDRLMTECRADGLPEYECHSMLRYVGRY